MKFLCISLFFLLLIWSCKDDVLLYSCDPVLNEIITTHKAEYVQYTVKDLIVSDLKAQRAIFRSYEPAKKLEIWLEKIKFLLENENFTPAEYAHVAKIMTHLSENYFDSDSIKAEAVQRTQFISDWISYAKNSLGWSEKYIAFVIYRLYTAPKQFDAEISAINTSSKQAMAGSEVGTCDCTAQSDYCLDSACGGGECTQTTGCGTFWQYSCTGICQN